MRPHDHNVNYTSLLHQHTVYKHTTLTLSTTPVGNNGNRTIPIMACSAFVNFEREISELYKCYSDFSQTGSLGKYVDHPVYKNEKKPSDATSRYLRGGIIDTMATFEAFLGELVNEAAKRVLDDPKYNHGKKHCTSDCDLEEINVAMNERHGQTEGNRPHLKPEGVPLHSWDTSNWKCVCTCSGCTKAHRPGVYPRYLLKDSQIQGKQRKSFIDVLMEQGEFNFLYDIRDNDGEQLPPTTFKSKCSICVMLKFCYGFRNVMAHGNSTQTYAKGGVFDDFVERCKPCGCEDSCPECKCFKNTATLVDRIYNKYIKQLPEQESKEAESTVRRIPKITDFPKFWQKDITGYLTKSEWNECERIIDVYFQDQDKDPLPASYAYFHMLRVYYWLDENKRAMYVTYGMFERITTFIHTLSIRMYLAVAELLIDNYKLTGGVWGTAKIRGIFTSQFTKLIFFDCDSLKIPITLENIQYVVPQSSISLEKNNLYYY